MKIRRFALFFLAILAVSGLAGGLWWKLQKKTVVDGGYFFSLPPVALSAGNIPCLNIKIGNKIRSALLDLGSSSDVSATQKIVQEIEEKSFVRTAYISGWDGKEYQENVYEIPLIAIGGLSFYDLYLLESSPEFEKNVAIVTKDHALNNYDEVVRLGWRLFRNTNLFLDLNHSQLIVCDSAATLKKHGYDLDCFAKTRLIRDRAPLEIDAVTPNGVLRCFLDTGATMNTICSDPSDERTIEQLMTDPENIEEFASFQIGGTELGPIIFQRVSNKFQTRTDAVLGMEFFLKHQVFIDFSKDEIYFAPSTPESIPK